MPWRVAERRIGRAGGVRQRTERQHEWDDKYGQGNWEVGYVIDGYKWSNRTAAGQCMQKSRPRGENSAAKSGWSDRPAPEQKSLGLELMKTIGSEYRPWRSWRANSRYSSVMTESLIWPFFGGLRRSIAR